MLATWFVPFILMLSTDGANQMADNVEIGLIYASNRQIVKVAYKNANMAGYDCYTWVKSKQNWTKKTSYYDVQQDRWKKVENFELIK